MNVYFINPTYVKPEGWKPLLNYLKVKAAYSFIPKEELPASLYSIIGPYLKASYANQDMKKFSDSCAYWLRAHFEKHIRLISNDFEDINNIPKEERKKYSSQSALNNIRLLDEDNCLILIKLESSYNEQGIINEPHFYVRGLFDSNLPTHIANYCLNILHKKYGHYQYNNQSAFIVFNEFFTNAYRFLPRYRRWNLYLLSLTNGRNIGFMYNVNKNIRNLEPQIFPLIEVDGKKRFTPLRTEEGDDKLRKLIKEAEEVENSYQDDSSWRDSGDSWQDEVDEMNRDFWKECGEAGSNCESWPGWD